MDYLSVAETAIKWGLSERSVRNYCAAERIPGAYMIGKTWNIPDDAEKPDRHPGRPAKRPGLDEVLKREMEAGLSGGIYHRVQIDFTYNSNHIEGSRLTHDQTRYIFETNTLGLSDQTVNVDDIVETVNHFRCIDRMIADSGHQLSESWIRQIHGLLKSGTSDSRKSWFAVGAYKKLPNEVGGLPTASPDETDDRMKKLLKSYNAASEKKSNAASEKKSNAASEKKSNAASEKKSNAASEKTYNAVPGKTLEELLQFHVDFERIHPFQDGNGRVGRIILFKECLRNGIVPFIITDEMKLYYYRGLQEWDSERGYLLDTCLAAQDQFKKILDYFGIPY